MLLHISKARKGTKTTGGGGGGGDLGLPNKPVGLGTLIFNSNWNTFPNPGPDVNGWIADSDMSEGSIFSDATVPYDPPSVFRTRFRGADNPPAFGGGSAPLSMFRPLSPAISGSGVEWYFAYYVKRTAGWDDGGNVGTKHFFFLTPYAGNANYTHMYCGIDPDTLPVASRKYVMNLESGDQGQVANFEHHSTPDAIAFGNWALYEHHIKYNTTSASDGFIKVWENNVLIMNMTNVRMFPAGVTPSMDQIIWTPTYGGGTNPVPLTQNIDLGRTVLYKA